MKRIAGSLALCLTLAAGAATVYVDVNRPDDSGDGRSWETAKHTIQAAVNLAAIGDTVLVAPGVYDEGWGCPTGEPDYRNRVYLPRGITLKSTQGADVTHIVGARDPDTEGVEGWMGCGPKAVRCVLATDTAHETVIEGFTLRGGATHPKSKEEGADAANGGAFRAAQSAQRAALVDCVVSNNVGIRGGAVYRGCCVRSRFHGNLAVVKGALGNQANFHFCVASGNTSTRGGLCVSGASANCTYVNNRVSVLLTEGGRFYNTVAVQNGLGLNACNSGNTDRNTAYACSVIPNDTMIGSADAASVTNATSVQFFAPYIGDYRPLPSSDLVGRASEAGLDAVALPSAVVRDRDIDGKPVDRTRPFQVGAVQTLSPEPASGCLWFTDANVEIDGRPGDGNANYLFTETYPAQIRVRPLLTGTQRLYCWNVQGVYRAPLPDESLWFLLPAPGQCHTNVMRVADRTVYVDPAAAPGGNGSSDAPYRTIQAAVDADSAGATGYHVIQLAAGRYDSDEDVKEGGGCTNRVSVPVGYPVRIVGAGEDKTFIVGRPDPTGGPAGDGRGPGAIRCVNGESQNSGHCLILQNLTLADGFCNYIGDGTGDTEAQQGGGVRVVNSLFTRGQLADCTVTNCWAYRGATYGVTAYRSRYVDCWGGNGGIRYSKLIACVVEHMRNPGGNANPLSYNCLAYNSTFVHDDSTQLQVVNVGVTNSVVVGTKQVTTTSAWAGSFVWNVQQGVPASSVPTLADPQFTRQADRDYRPLSTSPLRGGAVWYDDLPLDYSPDRDGNPMSFVAGRPSAGAYQTFRPGWSVELATPSYGVTDTCDASYGELTEGEPVPVALDVSAATRPFLGIAVNGTLQPGVSATNLVPAASDLAAGGFRVQPVFGTNWYVNATSGSDAADGWTPATAKKTFQGVFTSNAVLAGDVVHAAPGTYDEGDVPGDQYTWVKNRLAIPSGVCVVGDEGAEKTIIRGADAVAPIVDAIGRGTNATRCVFMTARSEIRGFTLTGGRTCGDGGMSGSANYGGGVYANGGLEADRIGNVARVVDCIISNNASCRGGGAHNVALVNCQLYDNWAKNNRAAASNCHLFNCVIDRNRGQNSLQNCYHVYNCTFGPDAKKEDGSATPAYGLPTGPVVNCLFLGETTSTTVQSDASTTLFATNCVFVAQPTGTYYTYENCRQVADPGVDAGFRPALNAPAVDFGDQKLVPQDLLALGEGRDVLGAQRVYNGRIDVGAVEADWRPRFAQDIRASGIAVTAASPEVVESAQRKVRIPAGVLETTLTGGGRSKVIVTVALHGAGALTATVDGEALAPASLVDGVATYAFRSPGPGAQLAFAYEPSAADDYAEIAGIDFRGGLSVIFR